MANEQDLEWSQKEIARLRGELGKELEYTTNRILELKRDLAASQADRVRLFDAAKLAMVGLGDSGSWRSVQTAREILRVAIHETRGVPGDGSDG